jgi:hypothetical protein
MGDRPDDPSFDQKGMMTPGQQTQKRAQDGYAQRGRSLSSSVQRLRGWVGSDPARTPELADALIELTAHRLRGHGYATAVADAQEAVQLTARLLTANGPIGPYTSVDDAVRCLTALAHVATIQAGSGRPDAAGRTLDSLEDLREQLDGLPVVERLKPETVIWALAGRSRAALAAGQVDVANAYVDALLDRLSESGLADSTAGGEAGDEAGAAYLVIDAERLASDCRWAAGRAEEALTRLHLAKDRYDEVVAGRLREPGRLSPALTERLAEPLFGLYRDMADRLAATGLVDLALATRRDLAEILEGLVGRLGDRVRIQLASALADLAGDLLAVDRLDEAEAAAVRAGQVVRERSVPPSSRWLVAAVHARVLTQAGRSADAVGVLRSALPAEADADAAPSAVHAVALAALAEALRAQGADVEAETTERQLDELSERLVDPSAGGAAARSAAVQDLARGVVSRGAEPVSWAPLSTRDSYTAATAALAAAHADAHGDLAAEQRDTAAWLEAEGAEAHRREQERLLQARIEAERREAERFEAERVAAEQLARERAEAEAAERREAEERTVAEEAERLAVKRRREERLEEHRLEVERQEAERREAERREAEASGAGPDELELAQKAWAEAKARGDRRATRLANEQVVEVLRPRAVADLSRYGRQLHQALEELSSARLRSGDVWGSRAPAREAKALAKSLGALPPRP